MQTIDPYKVWMILSVAMGGIWFLGFYWTRSLAKHLSLRRELRFGWAQVGDRLEERFTISNSGFIPALWVEIIDQSDMPGYFASRIAHAPGYGSTRWKTGRVCERRGLFTLGPTAIRSGDPFGIYAIEIHYPTTATLMVMPPVVPLPDIEVAAGGRSGEGRPRANAPERTVSISTVREYSPGDSLKYIHWPTTARRSKPFVRIFDGTPAGDWWILLDLQGSVQVGEGWDSTLEHGIVLSASLCDRGLRQGKSVGLAANSKIPIWLPPKGGEKRRWEALRHLALAEAGQYTIDKMLRRNKSAIGQYTSLVIITPNVTGSWLEALLPLIWRGVVPTILLLDPRTFNGQGNPKTLQVSLTQMGIACYVIEKDTLEQPELRPGQEGRWEFRVTALGKAVPTRTPKDLSWRVLT